MQNIIFVIVGLVHLGVAIYGVRNIAKKNWYAILVLIVVFGLAYDNFAIASGAIFGEGDVTKALNVPRYWVHAIFTPTMMIAAFGALRMSGVKFAQSKTWHIVICIIATAMIALGSYIDILNLQLEPNVEAGVIKYSNGFEFMKGPPIPAVLTILFTIAFGVSLWRAKGFKALFIGSILMFLTAPQPIGLVQNIGEVAFAVGLVLTQVYASKQ